MSLATAERETLAAAIGTAGWAVTPPVVPQLTLDVLVDMLSPLERAGGGGARNLFETVPAVRALAASSAVRAVAEAVLGPHCFAVRAQLVDGTAEANWKVVWHQDLTIAVRERASLPGYGPWSEHAGVPHVQPPIELLERMLAVRVHLDDCGVANGPVRVLDGSHRVGRLSPEAIDHWRAHRAPVECLVERGGILALRPLLLHAAAPAASPAHRRVIHFGFAAEELPPPLEWHARIA